MDPVFVLAQQLLDCLCARLADTIGGPVCRCCLHPGPVPMDVCCACGDDTQGQAAVRVVQMYPSRVFPTPESSPSGNCFGAAPWAATLEMVVYRCVHTVDSRGLPPSCDDLTADVEMILADAEAMRTAALCCIDEDTPLQVGQWNPVAPAGGCAGGTLQLVVGFDRPCCDETSPS